MRAAAVAPLGAPALGGCSLGDDDDGTKGGPPAREGEPSEAAAIRSCWRRHPRKGRRGV